MNNVSATSIAPKLLAKEPLMEVDFTKHPNSVTQSGKVKLVRYQENPTAYWGPGKRATGKTATANGGEKKDTGVEGLKRKRGEDVEMVKGD